jgi:murein tripeptide amidase MpaA
MQISAAFDGGNIEVLGIGDHGRARLAIRKDHQSDFFQWFYFRVSGAKGLECRLEVVNASEAAYADGWRDYKPVASYDRERWFRTDAAYVDGQLIIHLKPEHDAVWVAFFAPYSMERHQDLIARCQQSPAVRLEVLGDTLDGQPLDLLHIAATHPPPARQAWIIARQHPGETMAEWWMEGFLGRLLDEDDPVARSLLGKLTFHVVPNMNPDGSRRGHLRTNAAGANLNREWAEPSLEKSPEVFLVRQRMDVRGVDFFLDVHGDEELPYNFISGCDGIPSLTERQVRLQERYKAALMLASPDFQTTHGYPVAPPNGANLTMATAQVAERFGCVAMTLEMPFKDTADTPQPKTGWSPERCRKLGRACLDALHAVVDDLR